MEVKLTDSYKSSCSDFVNGNLVIETCNNPDKEDSSPLGEDFLAILTKNFETDGKERTILVHAIKNKKTIEVLSAFIIPPELKDFSPLKALENFAKQFGLAMEVGHEKSKFVYHQTFWSKTEQIPIVSGESREKFISSMFVKFSPHGQKFRVEVHTAFCIDSIKYENWLKTI